ncbi:GtrA family protein [Priestia megaterium]|uniref:GtrA family protein n=1 Tax=Priestia megaterium TaxID=1404 RepID=UPI001C2301B1|nr:GtrA family protein [Priestia megaterium]MBU8589673.1 GtrA family protein [Priestia megaterium]
MPMLNTQFVRFVIVGFLNTFNYYIIYLICNYLFHLEYLVSHIIGFLISMVGSFFLNSYFTYKVKPTLRQFFQFPLTYVVNITVSTSALYLLVDLMHMNETISPILASVIAIPFTFVISKKILVNKAAN